MFNFINECWCEDVLNLDYNKKLISLCTLIKTQAMFKYKGLPDTVTPTELEMTLQCRGLAAGIIHNDKPYIVPAAYAGRLNQNYFPTQCIIANPYLDISKTFDIGKDCFPIRNDSMVIGLLPIIEKYAYLIARNEITLKVKDTMSRTPYIITATSDNAKAGVDLFLQHLDKGDIAFIKDNKIMNIDDVSVLPATNTSRDITESMEYHQYLKGCFAHEIGLNANYNLKREYVSEGETGLNEDMLQPFIDNMLECRQRDLKAFNDYAGLSIEVELNSAWADNKEVEENAKSNNDTNANVISDNVTA